MTKKKAARLLAMRDEEFAELADLRLIVEKVERAAWDYYEERFNYRLPECDPRCATGKARAYEGAPRGVYAKEPSANECKLLVPPQRHPLRELVPVPTKPDGEIARYLLTHRIPLWKRFPDPQELTGTENELQPLELM